MAAKQNEYQIRSENIKYRKALGNWTPETFKNPMAATFLTNIHKTRSRDYSTEAKLKYLQDALDYVDQRVMNSFLGKRFRNRKMHLRTKALLYVEHVNTNLHLHGHFDCQDFDLTELTIKYNYFWKEKYPAGDVEFKSIWHKSGWAGYCQKKQKGASCMMMMIPAPHVDMKAVMQKGNITS